MASRRFPRKRRDRALARFVVSASAAPTAAHRPVSYLGRVMDSKEKYFQLIDRPAPAFELMGAGEKAITLADFTDKIVVLHFVYASCPDVCPLHAEKIADVQAKINLSPMKDMVQFVTITTDPEKDTADVLAGYGPAHGLDPANWTFLTTLPEQAEDSTRTLAQAFGHSFTTSDDGYQTHGVVTHITDRGARKSVV